MTDSNSPTGSSAEARRIWVVTDGRAGNEVPAESLATALAAARRPAETVVEVKRLSLRRCAAALPAPLWPMLATGEREDCSGWPFSGLEDRGAALTPPWPDLVIAAGRRAAPIAAEMRRRSQGRVRAIQILDPKLAPQRFDLVIVPAHDRLVGETVLSLPAALGRAAPEGAVAPDPRLAGLPRPLVVVLLGGPSRAAKLAHEDIEALASRLVGLAARGAGIAVLGSRRTPDWAAPILRRALGDAGGAFVWDGSGENPYRAALAAADAFIVTADSVNMTSEAAATGQPVYAAPVAHLAAKLQRFQEAMIGAGHIKPLADLGAETPLAGPEAWRPVALDTLAIAVERATPLLERP